MEFLRISSGYCHWHGLAKKAVYLSLRYVHDSRGSNPPSAGIPRERGRYLSDGFRRAQWTIVESQCRSTSMIKIGQLSQVTSRHLSVFHVHMTIEAVKENERGVT
jgi:hypothetical protein